MPRHTYHMHAFRLGYLEFIRVGRPHFFIAAVLWPLGRLGVIRWNPTVLHRYDHIQEMEVAYDQAPDFAAEVFEQTAHLAETIGFDDRFVEYSESQDSAGNLIRGAALWMRHREGTMLVGCPISQAATGQKQHVTAVYSWLAADRMVVTSGHHRQFDPEACYEVRWFPGTPLDQLVKLHRQRLERMNAKPQIVSDRNAMIEKLNEIIGRYFDSMVLRGVMTPVDEAREMSASEDANPYRPPRGRIDDPLN